MKIEKIELTKQLMPEKTSVKITTPSYIPDLLVEFFRMQDLLTNQAEATPNELRDFFTLPGLTELKQMRIEAQHNIAAAQEALQKLSLLLGEI